MTSITNLQSWVNAHNRMEKDIIYYTKELGEYSKNINRNNHEENLFSETEEVLMQCGQKLKEIKNKIERFYDEAIECDENRKDNEELYQKAKIILDEHY